MQIIGINGFKRSGKNTAYEIIARTHEHTIGVGFADKLKVMAAQAFGFVGEDHELIALMDEYKETGFIIAGRNGRSEREFTGREYLQWFGGNARRVFGDTFWIDQVLPDPQRYHDEDKSDRLYELLDDRCGPDGQGYPWMTRYLCITDLRYPNEAARIREYGGTILEITRSDLSSDGHDSEQPLPRDLVDYTIRNDYSLAEFATEISAFMAMFDADA